MSELLHHTVLSGCNHYPWLNRDAVTPWNLPHARNGTVPILQFNTESTVCWADVRNDDNENINVTHHYSPLLITMIIIVERVTDNSFKIDVADKVSEIEVIQASVKRYWFWSRGQLIFIIPDIILFKPLKCSVLSTRPQYGGLDYRIESHKMQ